jgi:mono/diheme cytochrome c family protein
VATDADGNYDLSGLAAGSYQLSASNVSGYVAFAPSTIDVTLGPDASGKDFSAAPSAGGAVTYETGSGQIKALMDQHCAVCHQPDSPEGGQPYFRNWAEVAPYVADIDQRVLPPEDGGIGDMPQRPQTLTDDERHIFKLWKDNGNAQ